MTCPRTMKSTKDLPSLKNRVAHKMPSTMFKRSSLVLAGLLIFIKSVLLLVENVRFDHIPSICSFNVTAEEADDCIDLQLLASCTVLLIQSTCCFISAYFLEVFDQKFRRQCKTVIKSADESLCQAAKTITIILALEIVFLLFNSANISMVFSQLDERMAADRYVEIRHYNIVSLNNGTAGEKYLELECLDGFLAERSPYLLITMLSMFVFLFMCFNSVFNILQCLYQMVELKQGHRPSGFVNGRPIWKEPGYFHDEKPEGVESV